jgi:predicted small secreted protein
LSRAHRRLSLLICVHLRFIFFSSSAAAPLRNLRVEPVFVPSDPMHAKCAERRRALHVRRENVVIRMKLWSLLLTVLLLGAVGPTLGGCNTTEGFGEDVERAGEEIQEEAEEAK